MNIEVNVSNKIARLADKDTVGVCGNSDYVIRFNFDDEWNTYENKTARFKWGGSYTDVVFTGNQCNMPVIYDSNRVEIGVFAGDLHTTTSALLKMKKSVLCDSGAPADPEPDVYGQIMELLNKMGIKGASMREKNGYIQYSVDNKVWTNLVPIADITGAPGKDGEKGANGITPTIGDNENWYLGDTDTGKPSRGAGMDITGATVGQIAKITAVDDNGKPTAWKSVDMEEKWELLTTIDVSQADAFEVDFDAPVKKLYYESDICDTAGEQYTASKTVYRKVFVKVGGALKELRDVNIGACKHAWNIRYTLFLICDQNIAFGAFMGNLTKGADTGIMFPLHSGINTYDRGNVDGIKIQLILPDGTENTATGKIKVWGVKA